MNQQPLKISIVTPSFNQDKYIRETIESVLSQKYDNLEYFVIDGKSTDRSVSILREYEQSLRWVSEPDNGQSDAINKGLRMTTGDIITYLNSDDILLPGSLQAVSDYFSSHPTCEWVTGYTKIIDEKGTEHHKLITAYKNFLIRHYRWSTLMVTNYLNQMSTFWRKTAMDAVGFFAEDEHFVMDYEYWIRLAKRGKPGIIPRELSCFRLHSSSKSVKYTRRQIAEAYQIVARTEKNFLLRLLNFIHGRCTLFIYSLQNLFGKR